MVPGQERHVPGFEILVIDEGHLPQERLEPLDDPVAGVFQLERSSGVEEIRRIIDTLLDVLDDPELRGLRRDLATWLRRAVLPGCRLGYLASRSRSFVRRTSCR